MPPHPANSIAKRSNWAAEQGGVILDFCIVFILLCAILTLIVIKFLRQRREERAQWTVEEITEVPDKR